jgi:hypothetical protein
MRRLWQRHPRLLAGFALAVVVAAALLLRGLMLLPHQGDPDRPVAPWMTPKFIVHTYDLEGPEVGEILGLEPGSRPTETIEEIARDQGRPLAAVMRALQAAVDSRRGGTAP